MGFSFTVILVLENNNQNWEALVPTGTRAFFFDICESTNTLAVEEGIKGAQNPAWYIAAEQAAGKARRGRAWTSTLGNLYCSYLFQPAEMTNILTALPFITSLAIRDTLIALDCEEDTVKCKWPNDVLLNEKKVSGVLIETSAVSNKAPDFIVIGIGLNVAHSPADTLFPATSIAANMQENIDVMTAFKALSHALEEKLSTWVQVGTAKIVEEWTQHAWGLGSKRQINAHNESFHATLIGLEPDGALKLEMDDGTIKRLYAGDVFGSADV